MIFCKIASHNVTWNKNAQADTHRTSDGPIRSFQDTHAGLVPLGGEGGLLYFSKHLPLFTNI